MPVGNPVGELSYNGYTFDGSLRVKVNTDFVYDEAGRTVTYHKHTITATAVVTAGLNGNTDLSLDAIRRLLGRPGGRLSFRDKGFGDLQINTARDDVLWGPKPKVLQWEPVGSANACMVVWQVEIHIGECFSSGFIARNPAVMAFNYEASYDVNQYGFTTRTLRGYLQISMTRLGAENRTLSAVADQFRELINAEVPLEFRRTTNQWSTNDAKNRLEFTLTDQEIESPNAFPEGVADIQGTHDASWSRGGDNADSAAMLRNTINVTIRRKKTHSRFWPRSHAWRVFLSILQRRRDIARSQGGRGVLLDELRVSEDLFGYPARFSASYRIYGDIESATGRTTPGGQQVIGIPGNIVNTSGLFTPFPLKWGDWLRDMAAEHGQRGLAQLALLPGNDAIVDLCGGQPTIAGSPQSQPVEAPETTQSPYNDERPTAELSWLGYSARLQTLKKRNLAVHVPVQEENAANFDNPGAKDPTKGMQGPPEYGSGNLLDAIIQESGGTAYFFRFSGFAERVEYDIPRPALKTIGGQEPVLVTDLYQADEPRRAFGVTVYKARWDQIYAVKNAPSSLPRLRNLT